MRGSWQNCRVALNGQPSTSPFETIKLEEYDWPTKILYTLMKWPKVLERPEIVSRGGPSPQERYTCADLEIILNLQKDSLESIHIRIYSRGVSQRDYNAAGGE